MCQYFPKSLVWTTIAPWSTTEEVEYEIVEVEVDEDGNEIVADKGRSAEQQQQPTAADSKAPKQALDVVEEIERQAERAKQELEGRRRLVEAQKRQLHLPPGTQVEYVDAGGSSIDCQALIYSMTLETARHGGFTWGSRHNLSIRRSAMHFIAID